MKIKKMIELLKKENPESELLVFEDNFEFFLLDIEKLVRAKKQTEDEIFFDEKDGIPEDYKNNVKYKDVVYIKLKN